jgi:prostamide/prostaglandin F2alpha synthase
MSTDAGKKLEDVVVTRYSDKAQVRLGDLWKEQGVLLCLFRRWGCGLCRISAVNISGLKPILDQNNIALIGMGTEELGIDEFIREEFFAGELCVDPGKKSYQALDCKANSWRNLWGLFSGIMKFIKFTESKGYKSNFKGDFNQLGGTFLIAKGGKTLYAHRQTNESFEPDLKQIVEALGTKLPADFVFYPAYGERQQSSSVASP